MSTVTETQATSNNLESEISADIHDFEAENQCVQVDNLDDTHVQAQGLSSENPEHETCYTNSNLKKPKYKVY